MKCDKINCHNYDLNESNHCKYWESVKCCPAHCGDGEADEQAIRKG